MTISNLGFFPLLAIIGVCLLAGIGLAYLLFIRKRNEEEKEAYNDLMWNYQKMNKHLLKTNKHLVQSNRQLIQANEHVIEAFDNEGLGFPFEMLSSMMPMMFRFYPGGFPGFPGGPKSDRPTGPTEAQLHELFASEPYKDASYTTLMLSRLINNLSGATSSNNPVLIQVNEEKDRLRIAYFEDGQPTLKTFVLKSITKEDVPAEANSVHPLSEADELNNAYVDYASREPAYVCVKLGDEYYMAEEEA